MAMVEWNKWHAAILNGMTPFMKIQGHQKHT